MATVTVRQVQHNLAQVLERVGRGEEITITKRGTVIGRIVPARNPTTRLAWPDSASRMKRLEAGLTTKTKGMAPSKVIAQLRGERL